MIALILSQIIQLNAVLFKENDREYQVPVNIAYNHEVFYMQLRDTIETYRVLKTTEVRGASIIYLSSPDYLGMVRIHHNHVYFYLYRNHKRLERHLVIDTKQWLNLKQRERKNSKISRRSPKSKS